MILKGSNELDTEGMADGKCSGYGEQKLHDVACLGGEKIAFREVEKGDSKATKGGWIDSGGQEFEK